MGMRVGESVADYGCGEGKSVAFFNRMGFNAHGVEHARNAPSAGGITVYESCLWDMEGRPDTDYAFCCDVMEHIPEFQVREVVRQIAVHTKKHAYFRISTTTDVFGERLGVGPLHLTVKPVTWWIDVMENYFGDVRPITSEPGHCVIVCDVVSQSGA